MIYLKKVFWIINIIFLLSLKEHIQSSPASLDAGDLFDFNGLCQHFAAKTPQSFRKVRESITQPLIIYAYFLYVFCVWLLTISTFLPNYQVLKKIGKTLNNNFFLIIYLFSDILRRYRKGIKKSTRNHIHNTH